ncbi:MAG: hypothetical protein ACI4RP_00530 [Acutalibacteraceae bacterium]
MTLSVIVVFTRLADLQSFAEDMKKAALDGYKDGQYNGNIKF